jgi:FkbM family methyltransferase
VIDVGVADGTPEIYDVFSDAYFLLVEPLVEFEPLLQETLRSVRGSYVLAAAGAEPGDIPFHMHTDHMNGSSLYRETMGSVADGKEITVPMIRIDDLCAERKLEAPFLIKVDVQGAELLVLEGCPETLRQSEVVVLEVSLFEFMSGAPQLYDVLHYMKQRGWVAYDIIPGWNRPLDGALGQVDIAFVKEHGVFRSNHAYSSVQQLADVFRS